ncbi:MAG: T9SS type A sorting domain-containing protein [Bacteroidota bacterium]|nr:T9SS type A sorting domain-containing protein [Bacteroidota bacterium]
MKKLILLNQICILLLSGVLLPTVTKAQTPIKLKLIGAFLDSNGYTFDTLYFGFNKDGGPGVQEGLDVLDTSNTLSWGTYDPSTPDLRYKTNIREFEPFTFTSFQIYARKYLRYIAWDTAEYFPKFYNYDFTQLGVSLISENAFFGDFQESFSHQISGSLIGWPNTEGVNPVDTVKITIIGFLPKLRVSLGVKDSIPTGVKKLSDKPACTVYHVAQTNEIYIINPEELTLNAELINALGQPVFNLNALNDTKSVIPVSGLPTGMYYIRVYSGNFSIVKRIIIN